ncbi:F11 receptor, tandem duplicate 1 [Anabas testudineus]|uniref:Junctional adhesion molecule A n=1 Tax=Anabas testudineus TaxID=64144 RepID=A0A3Q1IWX8_ANATE|nr:F11 receptor, tandem duplicate 1 [Anabas testudineus]
MFASGLLSVALFFVTAAGVSGFSVTTTPQTVQVKENEGTDLTCTYSADFGSSPRVEWKFQDLKGSTSYVVFGGQPTASYAGRVTLYNNNLQFSKMTRQDTGRYDCEVSGSGMFGEASVQVTVLVPPSTPVCRVPSTVTTGGSTILSCHDKDASPPPTYSWYKDGTLLPADPSTIAAFKNATYRLNAKNGNLEFPSVTKMDSGQYYCQASNTAGPAQSCKATAMEVRDLNTGGIVAGVIIFLLLLIVLGLAIWYAYKRGYLPQNIKSKSKPNAMYQSPIHEGDDGEGEFRPKSSFVV